MSLYPTVYCAIISAVVYFIYLLYHSLLIAVSLLLVSVLQLIPPLIVKKRLQKNYDDCREIEAEITDFTVDGYDAFPTIKLYSLKEWWLSKLNIIHKKYIKIGKDEIYADQLNNVMENFLSIILKYGTYGLIGIYVLLGIAGKEIAIQSIALSSSFFTAILTAFSSIPDFAISKVADERINSFLQTQMNESSSAVTVGNICLSEVSASLGKKRILQDASVCFSSELNIIKGANGVGKSTLLNLIVGLIKPDCGNISVGNTESEQLSDVVFPKKIKYIMKEGRIALEKSC